MKVAVTANGKNLGAQIDPRFGRCAYFIIVETNDMQFEAFSNEQAASMAGGAGIQSAQFLVSKAVLAVLTGRCGPKAVSALSAARIDLFLDQTGTVRDVVERFKNQALQASSTANVEPHHGLEQVPFADGPPNPPVGSPTEMGRGMGRGMGQDRGMGGGMGQGRGMGGGGGGGCRRR